MQAQQNLWAIRFRFAQDLVDDLLGQAAGKLAGWARDLAVYLIDTSSLEHGILLILGSMR